MCPWLMSTLFPLPETWNSHACRDKTSQWPIGPKGAEIFLRAAGSCSAERPKARERKLGAKLNDLTPSLPAEFLGDSGLWKALIKTRRREWPRHSPESLREDMSSGMAQILSWLLAAVLGRSPMSYSEMAFDGWGGACCTERYTDMGTTTSNRSRELEMLLGWCICLF